MAHCMTYLGHTFPPYPWNKTCVSYIGIYFAMHTPASYLIFCESLSRRCCTLLVESKIELVYKKGLYTSQKRIYKIFNILSSFMLWLLMLKHIPAWPKSFPCHTAATVCKASTSFTISYVLLRPKHGIVSMLWVWLPCTQLHPWKKKEKTKQTSCSYFSEYCRGLLEPSVARDSNG